MVQVPTASSSGLERACACGSSTAGRTVRTAIGRRTVSAGTLRWRWNGRTATGARVPAGRYRFVLDATTSVGRETIAIATTMP